MAIIPDWTLILQIINFLALVFILNQVCYKPIRGILIERKQKVQGFEQDIDGLKQEAAESDENFQTKIGQAKSKGYQQQEALKESAEEEEKKLIEQIHQTAQADLETVRAQIAKDAEGAKLGLQTEAQAFSAAIAEKILGRAVS
ncbi:MAG: ATP synthase F0 subunit B [Deltaproteobacteria bacterium]|nr:ATP synthase F0 subunit B [Deltaproteobacteria bacterium]